MSSNSAYPSIMLSIDPKTLEKVDLAAPVSYLGNGFIQIADFPRLRDEVSRIDPQDGFDCKIQSHQRAGKPALEIILKGQMKLVCQRCLQPFTFELDQQKYFVFVNTEEEADEFPMDNDQEEAMVASPAFDLLGAIEDEVLLAMPHAPKHPTGQCQLAHDNSDSDRQNPFKVLKSLKK